MTRRRDGGVAVGNYLAHLFRFNTLPLAFFQCTMAYVDMQT